MYSLDGLAVPIGGAVVSEISHLCVEFSTAFVGGYLERGADGRLYDSMLIVDADGGLAGNYRKTHLFGVESSLFDAGHQERAAVIDVPLRCDVPADINYVEHLRPELYCGQFLSR